MTDALQPNLVSQTWTGSFGSGDPVPESADVVIIGGGIIGVSTAWFLSKQGVDVVLCEKGAIAGEQSSRNWGWVRQQARDTRELPLMIDSMRVWEGLADDIGEDVGFSQSGCLFVARNDREMEGYAGWLETAREYELDTRVIDARELSEIVRGSDAGWVGAMYTPSDARAEPHKAAPAIARAAARGSASIHTGCAVRGIEMSGGRLSAVVTERGTIKTSTAVCAAGAWASMFCRSIGIRLPQLQVRGTVLRTAPGPDVLDGNLFSDLVGIRKREDGGYTVAHGSFLDHAITPTTFRFSMQFLPALMTELQVLRLRIGKDFIDELKAPVTWPLDRVSPFETQRVLNPVPNKRVVREIRTNLAKAFPALAEIDFVETWAGMVETTPDVIPVIDEAASIPGFYVATGFSGHGFGIGPGAGKAIATLVTGGKPEVDLHELRLSRFSDGSKVRPQKGPV